MKKSLIWLVVVVFAVSILFMGISCKEETIPAEETVEEATAEKEVVEEAEKEVPTEKKVIEFWTDKPMWVDNLNETFKLFTEKTDIEVKITPFTGVEAYEGALRQAISSPNAPELFTWWANWKIKELVDADIVVDLSPEYEPYEGKYSEDLLKALSANGRKYGAPLNLSYWLTFYSIPIFDKYKLEEPKTWEEFINICETLESNGITPLVQTITGSGWSSYIWFQELLKGIDPDAYEKLWLGEISWESEPIDKTFVLWRDLIKKGYFTDPSIDFATGVAPAMAKGEVGMASFGDWFTVFFDDAGMEPGVDYGAFILPSINPEVGKVAALEVSPIMVPKNSKDLDSSLKFVDWWLSSEAQEKWAKLQGFFPPNSDVPTNILDVEKAKMADEINEGDVRLIIRFFESIPTSELTAKSVGMLEDFIINPDNYKDTEKNLEDLFQGYWSEKE